MNKTHFFLKGYLSVFATASFLVYAYSAAEPLVKLSSSWNIPFLNQIISSDKIPPLIIIISLLHIAIAVRMYIHAWALDALPTINDFRNKSSHCLVLLLEWVIRIMWVVMVTCLPIVYTKIITPDGYIIGGILEKYYAILFGSLFIWDLVMYRQIKNLSVNFSYVNRDSPYITREGKFRKLKVIWFYVTIKFSEQIHH